ncbi:hypothetical protein CPAR01_10587 [Colletotrichum paranaense]|uniref:Uncharacterized protein n=1 Tax=Colletotrichum paranaense TaxID=1914294 RepID=A0ABQ9SEF3_9PEZI|nr:uncharacterized protein CPAR01_10587 [Colletotrichum paranaense]KAK1533879.1 hypothetical protein CPAR01_10587 [Colletotrichum paranaense]
MLHSHASKAASSIRPTVLQPDIWACCSRQQRLFTNLPVSLTEIFPVIQHHSSPLGHFRISILTDCPCHTRTSDNSPSTSAYSSSPAQNPPGAAPRLLTLVAIDLDHQGGTEITHYLVAEGSHTGIFLAVTSSLAGAPHKGASRRIAIVRFKLLGSCEPK